MTFRLRYIKCVMVEKAIRLGKGDEDRVEHFEMVHVAADIAYFGSYVNFLLGFIFCFR